MITDKKNSEEVVIDEVLSRGVEAIFPNKDFLKSKMMKGEKLSFYLGIDPTGPTLHLGHLIPLKKLAQLQKLGHKIILLIGDFTAMIGDPTDKMSARVPLTHEKVLENCRLYKEQASRFISFDGDNPATLRYNSEWLAKMTLEDILKLMSQVSHAQTIKRDMFQKRIEEGKDLFLHELMYPLMQGYDSVAMDVDGEVGGNDQTFNMLMGRDLMKKMKEKEKFVIASKLLIDSSGKKMGKTEGNMVSLDQSAEEIFGKVMSWADNLIIPGFEIITDISLEEIDSIKKSIESGTNPKEFKIKLAKEIINMIHGSEAAQKAEQAFEKTFSKGEVPDDIMEIQIARGSSVRDALVKAEVVSSNADWKRLVEGNAVSVVGTDEIISDIFLKASDSVTLRIGKKRFVKMVVN